MNLSLIKIQFSDNFGKRQAKKYDYYTTLEGLKIGDRVICPTCYGFSIGVVCSTTQSATVMPTKVVTQMVDETSGEELAKNIERKNELRKQMMKRKKELEEETIWQLLAERDPQMKQLLDEYNS